MADTFPLAAVGNPAAEFANKSKSVANKVLAPACDQWPLHSTPLPNVTTSMTLQPHAHHWSHSALLCCCQLQKDLPAALQAKSAAVPDPLDALSAKAKSVTQDAKAAVNGTGVPDPVRVVVLCYSNAQLGRQQCFCCCRHWRY
jgi:hypothetical protein